MCNLDVRLIAFDLNDRKPALVSKIDYPLAHPAQVTLDFEDNTGSSGVGGSFNEAPLGFLVATNSVTAADANQTLANVVIGVRHLNNVYIVALPVYAPTTSDKPCFRKNSKVK